VRFSLVFQEIAFARSPLVRAGLIRRFRCPGAQADQARIGRWRNVLAAATIPDNGMVERFNGRLGREVLILCIGTHHALNRMLEFGRSELVHMA
jgi:hypothetical protein